MTPTDERNAAESERAAIDSEAHEEVMAAQRLADRGRAESAVVPSIRDTHEPSDNARGLWIPKPSDRKRSMVFDCETAPLENALVYLKEEVIEAPGNYKDPVKIAAYIAEKRAEQLERCSLDPDLCRVVAIGLWVEGGRFFSMHAGDMSEEGMLEAFWIACKDNHLIGYNCLGFDLPVLMRRSLYLGVRVPDIKIDKYRHDGVSDLQAILSFNGQQKWRSLNFYCKRFGIEVADDIDGSQIGAAVERGDWKAIESHVTADVRKTALLAARMNLFEMAVKS